MEWRASWKNHPEIIRWVEEMVKLCKPDEVHLCDGSAAEFEAVAHEMASEGKLTRLDPAKRPHSFWCHSHPDDVARVEECTFICSQKKEDAGPTNNWRDPVETKKHLMGLFKDCMQGRVMYVIPFCMGPVGSPFSQLGVQITDSPYVVLNMRIMTHMGEKVLDHQKKFVPCLHSVGVPLKEGDKDAPWPCSPEKRIIAHFQEERSIWSFGSGYGGNALLGKKCLALRIASFLGKQEGWLAEHMLILGITSPKGEKKYFAAAFPSACGKTNLAMLSPSLPGWKIECVGDDIAWMRLGKDGRIYAVNPECGMFGVAPGTSMKTNPNAMKTISKNTIFTNVALTQDKDVWWEGMNDKPPAHATDWHGKPWTPQSTEKAAHPNARFTVPMQQCPIVSPSFDDPNGVPISAIIFGGRRSSTVPLVFQAMSWQHGVFLGASVSSETTSAAKGVVGKLRHDPFAMLPFCGYNMGDYFQHWLDIGKKTAPEKLPQIFHVNWFLKDEKGEFLWPGYGENIRVLEWIFERTNHQGSSKETPIGYVPQSINSGSQALLHVDSNLWTKEAEELEEYFKIFGNRFPKALAQELQNLKERLRAYSCVS
jgi:phosphoenolpyruvate carboxykinase (GTP)